jgi:hypothetical protein
MKCVIPTIERLVDKKDIKILVVTPNDIESLPTSHEYKILKDRDVDLGFLHHGQGSDGKQQKRGHLFEPVKDSQKWAHTFHKGKHWQRQKGLKLLLHEHIDTEFVQIIDCDQYIANKCEVKDFFINGRIKTAVGKPPGAAGSTHHWWRAASEHLNLTAPPSSLIAAHCQFNTQVVKDLLEEYGLDLIKKALSDGATENTLYWTYVCAKKLDKKLHDVDFYRAAKAVSNHIWLPNQLIDVTAIHHYDRMTKEEYIANWSNMKITEKSDYDKMMGTVRGSIRASFGHRHFWNGKEEKVLIGLVQSLIEGVFDIEGMPFDQFARDYSRIVVEEMENYLPARFWWGGTRAGSHGSERKSLREVGLSVTSLAAAAPSQVPAEKDKKPRDDKS